jgi:hypothetical protein
MDRDSPPQGHPKAAKWEAIVAKIQAKVGTSGNPFRRFIGQQMRILQGDGVALDTVRTSSHICPASTPAHLLPYLPLLNSCAPTHHCQPRQGRNMLASLPATAPAPSHLAHASLQPSYPCAHQVGDMLASLLANGFCSNVVNFGSGGGLLQKVNRDSLSCAFKCCAMCVNTTTTNGTPPGHRLGTDDHHQRDPTLGSPLTR